MTDKPQGPGEVVTMEPGLAHASEAGADSAFLLTLVETSRKECSPWMAG
jgi:hypothetical protein